MPHSGEGDTVFLVGGRVMVGGGFYWLIELLQRFADLSLPAALSLYVLFCVYQGIVFLLVRLDCAQHPLAKPVLCSSPPLTLLAPVVMVACELLVPLLFPSHLAIMQAWHPMVFQIADLTGPMGVTALLLMVNGAIYDLLSDRRDAMLPALASILVLTAALLYGYLRIQQFES